MAEQQQLIILCGVVGSGKSTFAHALVNQLPNWARVNQDDLGDRRACEQMVRMHLSQGKNVVVDRQNFDVQQRRTWLEMAEEFEGVSVGGLVMGTTPEECNSRLRRRTNHPTIDNPVLAIELLDKFLDLWVEPTLSEGFDHLLTLPPPLPDSTGLTASLLTSFLVALAASPLNSSAKDQRRPKPRAPYGGARGGYASQRGGRGGWGGQQQQQQSWGAPRQGGAVQEGRYGGAAPPPPPGGNAWSKGQPYAWGSGGQTLGGGAAPPPS